jgi:hypothetical protein
MLDIGFIDIKFILFCAKIDRHVSFPTMPQEILRLTRIYERLRRNKTKRREINLDVDQSYLMVYERKI